MIPLLLAFLTLGPEQRVTDTPRHVTTWVLPETPRVVSDGENFLVAWNNGTAAAHVSSSGDVLDHPSLRIDAPPNVRFFDLVRHDDEFVIGWYYFLDPGVVHIRVATLASTLFDVALAEADINSDSFRLVSNGSALAAMYRLKSGSTALTFFDSGRVVTLLANGEVASDGANFLVLQGTSAVLLTGSGDRIATVNLPFSATDVIFDGSDYVIVGSVADQIEIERVSRSAAVTSSTFVDRARGFIRGLTVAAAGSDVFVTWKEVYAGEYPDSSEAVSLQARSLATKTLDTPLKEVQDRFAAPPGAPVLASNGREYLLVWTEGTVMPGMAGLKLFSLLLHPSESLSPADADRRKQPVPSAFASQRQPASARNGDHLLLAWTEQFSDDSSGNVRQQIAASLLDGSSFFVAPDSAQQQNPTAAWDGKRTWIVWNGSTGGIQATYVLPGDSKAAVPIAISTGGVAPRIACGDGTCLVVWAENRSHDTNQHELFAARIVNGELLDPNGFLIGSGQSYVGTGDYDVATDGSHFEVVWADRVFYGGAILRSVFFDGPGRTTRDLAATTTVYDSAHVVWNGREYDVLWNETSTPRASRVSVEGNSIDGDVTGWQGVPVSFSATDVAAVGGRLYVGTSSSVIQIDPATFAVLGAADVGEPVTIAALDPAHIFAVYSKDGPLFIRRIGEGRARAVR